jgi:hypothetical protein
MLNLGSRDRSVRISTGYEMDGRGSIPGKTRDFTLLYSVQTGSGAHQASYPMGTGVKRSKREADHSSPSSAEVKNGGAIPPSPMWLHGIVLN